MYKQARGQALTTISPDGVGAFFNPALSSRALDMLGGVGEYTMPQRGVGMTLGALVGSHLGGPENREAGAVVGAGAGYAGAAGLDNIVGGTRRRIVNEAIDKSMAAGSIVNTTEDGLLNSLKHYGKPGWLREPNYEAVEQVADAYASPAFTMLGGKDSGKVVNNYDYMHRMTKDPKRIDAFIDRMKKVKMDAYSRDITEAYLRGYAPLYKTDPNVARYPLLSHELLERKDLMYNRNPVQANFGDAFKGKAKDVYGPSIGMQHNSMQVLADETNLALRTMDGSERGYMRELRNMTNEGPTIAAIKNVDDMYDVTLRPREMRPWAETTNTAINRGIRSGKLLSSAEQAVIDPGMLRRHSGRAGRALRQAEHAIASPISNALDATVGKGYNKLTKYLTKLL